jgi:hypothetical protein
MRILFQRVDKLSTDRRIHEITTKAMEEVTKRYSPEKYPEFTKEMYALLEDIVAKEFVLSFQHRLFKDR